MFNYLRLFSIFFFKENVKVFDNSILDEFVDSDFEEQVKQLFDGVNQPTIVADIELDGKINTEQIESFMKRLPTEPGALSSSPRFLNADVTIKRTDVEKIFDKIHGTTYEAPAPVRVAPIHPRLPHGHPRIVTPHGGFNGLVPNPSIKSFGQSIISQTIRKPDGTYETRRMVRDPDGNTKTTVTRTIDGKTETVTSYGNDANAATRESVLEASKIPTIVELDQNFSVTREGYMFPKNLC